MHTYIPLPFICSAFHIYTMHIHLYISMSAHFIFIQCLHIATLHIQSISYYNNAYIHLPLTFGSYYIETMPSHLFLSKSFYFIYLHNAYKSTFQFIPFRIYTIPTHPFHSISVNFIYTQYLHNSSHFIFTQC